MLRKYVLVVDGEPDYLRLTCSNLQADGFLVRGVETGEKALALLVKDAPCLVVLDVVLPDIDGFEVCRRIREISWVPIVIVTSRADWQDKVRGLELGADDYIAKPFSVRELLARVNAVLRRSTPLADTSVQQTSLTLGDLHIDFLDQRVTVQGQPVALSPTEFRLLSCLAAYPGALLTRHRLLEEVWGPTYRGHYDILRVTLWRLRQKLEEDPSNPQFIITQPGLGYMLVTPK